jgi:hypothetical protein
MRARLPLHILLLHTQVSREGGGREGERGGPLDLKMPLENGSTDERVSRGQASERAVCVCEAVSVEKGARRPLPTAEVDCRLSNALVRSLCGSWAICESEGQAFAGRVHSADDHRGHVGQ